QTDRFSPSRQSGVELLKIIAIFLIVVSHVVQTLWAENSSVPFQNYIIHLDCATTNLQYFVLTLFAHFGVWGNNIFFVSSAWFLGKSEVCKKRKMVTYVFRGAHLLFLPPYLIYTPQT
ncbi:MAG: hypothetical protein Q4E34_06020, partial [Synergistaceae bacterium]|nr:hypothetical protein [Synergistaceae bacterium]